MKYLFLLLSALLVAHNVDSALTEKQFNATKKLVRNTCQNKAKPTSEQIEAMQKGDFTEDKNVQLRKDNSFDWEGGIKTLNAIAPPHIVEPGGVSIENCKDAVKTPNDKCVASYEIAKCLYTDNTANYFLP